jgi:hypothetical protein
MTIKRGKFVCHSGALEWGTGKVLEVTPSMATIRFNDGINRKIASSHFATLQPADAAAYSPPPEASPVVKARPTPRTSKKK